MESNEIILSQEPFRAIQGEGKFRGIPSLFIRTAGCPLECEGCDTKYSWEDPETFYFSIEEICQIIEEEKDLDHIVFTGGEPAVFQEFISEIVEMFPNKIFTLETSGHILLSFKEFSNLYFSFSPKIGALKSLMVFNPLLLDPFPEKGWLKIVISKDCNMSSDFERLIKLTKRSSIYLMPYGAEKEEFLKNYSFVWNLCLKEGFNFSGRDHLLVEGDQKYL